MKKVKKREILTRPSTAVLGKQALTVSLCEFCARNVRYIDGKMDGQTDVRTEYQERLLKHPKVFH